MRNLFVRDLQIFLDLLDLNHCSVNKYLRRLTFIKFLFINFRIKNIFFFYYFELLFE